ncbi:hypothetical protein E4T56_gene4510 [Termitomyces sp. T112]|nr:hypothetical protein E4T56_gene4510 [Termitomyces sp. T112]
MPDPITHHQLDTLALLTYPGVLQQPQNGLHQQLIPSTYQHSLPSGHNQHPSTPSSSATTADIPGALQYTNQPLRQCPPAQLNTTNLHETPEPLDTNPNDHNNIPDPANDQEALCANRIWDSPWINMLEETQEKRWKEGMCILCGEQGHFICSCPKQQVMGHAMWMIDREDYHRPDPDIFSTSATLLHATIPAPDSPPVHLPFHSSTNLLLHTTLPFTDNSVPT